jgi:Flp pilus assembly protein TadD
LAISEFEKAAQRDPESSMVSYHLGLALVKANRLAEARQMLKKALQHNEFTEREAAEKMLAEITAG